MARWSGWLRWAWLMMLGPASAVVGSCSGRCEGSLAEIGAGACPATFDGAPENFPKSAGRTPVHVVRRHGQPRPAMVSLRDAPRRSPDEMRAEPGGGRRRLPDHVRRRAG
jgi:hypothetical protein